jgi:hypothetical protein
VPAAMAQRHLLVGIQDDSMTLHGNPQFTFTTLKELRTQIVRINLDWNDVAGKRPAHPQDPSDPAYDWKLYDRAIRYAAQYGMQVMLTILFTPSWANGGGARNVPPSNYADLRNFAYAAATRYSGHYIPNTDQFDEVYLPAVKYWLAWNEPNNPNWLTQVSGGRFVSPRSYARICTIWQGVHFTNFVGEKVGCGATGPRGNNIARSGRPSLAPLDFMRLARRAGLRNLDAYAHHPYYGKPSETPTSTPSSGAVTLGNIDTLISVVNKLWGKKRIWITEYGWQTRPPDQLFGVSYARQAAYLSQSYAIARANPRIDMMVWFMLRDDTNLSIGWQSGFLTASGQRKPAFSVFAGLPH